MTRAAYQPPVTLTCPVCQRDFTRFASQIEARGGRYCSNTCRVRDRQVRPRKCQRCGDSFIMNTNLNSRPGRGKFCSRSCFYEAKGENLKRKPFECKQCSKEFTVPEAWIRKAGKPKFCSRRCADMSKHRLGSTSFRGTGWDKIRAAIRSRDGDVCVRCGEANASGRKLSVDHVIPWILVASDESIANSDDNLASLCGPCHTVKTHHIEPRFLRGDYLALVDFYGPERANRANAAWNSMKEAS